MSARIRTGLDRFAAGELPPGLSGSKIGLLANQASVDAAYRHAADLLHGLKGLDVIRLFGPEHGFRGELQDMDAVGHGVDRLTGLPVVSLYGSDESTLAPKESDLTGLDVVVVDLPDIGARYYTFAQTMAYLMRTAGRAGVKVVVLDRPNPLNGNDIEGAALDSSCRSFCGYASIANRHGLTLGELAHLMKHGFGEGADKVDGIDCELEVVEVQGWSREMWFDETGLPWVLPSPNMPTLDTAIIYPGSCLFEATELSEGRGTTKPLEMFGAPYIDGSKWAAAVANEGIKLEGAVLRPTSFLPKFQKHAGSVCGGVQLHVTDRRTFRPFRWCLALIAAAKRLYPNEFAWRHAAFEFIDKVPAIDLLYGSDAFRLSLEQDAPLGDLLPQIERYEAWYRTARQPFLRY